MTGRRAASASVPPVAGASPPTWRSRRIPWVGPAWVAWPPGITSDSAVGGRWPNWRHRERSERDTGTTSKLRLTGAAREIVASSKATGRWRRSWWRSSSWPCSCRPSPHPGCGARLRAAAAAERGTPSRQRFQARRPRHRGRPGLRRYPPPSRTGPPAPPRPSGGKVGACAGQAEQVPGDPYSRPVSPSPATTEGPLRRVSRPPRSTSPIATRPDRRASSRRWLSWAEQISPTPRRTSSAL